MKKREVVTDKPCIFCGRQESGNWISPCPSDDCPSHKNPKTKIPTLVGLVLTTGLSYNEDAKTLFHSLAKSVCKEIAAALELPKGSFDIRSNMAGIAVSGEVVLHGENIYVMLDQSSMKDSFMFRSCKGRQDYVGGPNQWAEWKDLLDFPAFIAKLKQI